MKQIVCELCGSNDLIKKNGVYVCQHCGTQYDTEEVKKLLIEVDTAPQLNNLYEQARRAKSTANFEAAQNYYGQIAALDANSWEAYFYSVYFQQVNCKVKDIPMSAEIIGNSIEPTFELINKYVSEEEKEAIYADISDSLLSASFMMLNAANNYLDKFRDTMEMVEQVKFCERNITPCTDFYYKFGKLLEDYNHRDLAIKHYEKVYTAPDHKKHENSFTNVEYRLEELDPAFLARKKWESGYRIAAKIYYDKILAEKPTDWEASFFSSLGNAYGIARGKASDAVDNLAKDISVEIDNMVKSTDDVDTRIKNLYIIVENTVDIYTYLYNNKVSMSIEDIRNFVRIVVECVGDMGYQIQKLGEAGMLGDELQWKPIFAKALKWRTEFALSAPKVFDETDRNKYADELSKVDPTYKKPEIKASPACYVATAVYGSYDCPEVWTLRRFRDYSLAETWYGRAFVRTYYAISPTLVKWFGDTAWFKSLWRVTLDKMVNSLKNKGYDSTPYEDREW